MITTRITLFSALLTSSLLAAEPLCTIEGDDPSWADVLKSDGVKVGERFSKGPVLGSRIEVDNGLLEKQVGEAGTIPKEISIHTEASGGIRRKDFGKWTRWYQEDGNVQVFRLFEGEQNVRDGTGEHGSQGRIEAFTPGRSIAPGEWGEWEGTYTIIKPVGANIFQLMHDGKDKQGHSLLWPFHIMMNDKGDIYFDRRREVPGMEGKIVMAENMVGKSLSVKVRANGEDFEIYQKEPLGDAPWKLVTKGSYAKAEDNRISFRWGMYVGSKKGHTVPNDALLLVTGVTIR